MWVCIKVSRASWDENICTSGLPYHTGIGPKVTQSAITAAFLFAFKDVIYGMTVAARRKSQAVSK